MNLAADRNRGVTPVVSYARTSEDGRRDGQGVRYQLRVNERIAREWGCRVVAVYTDNGVGASKAGVVRPEFDRLIGDLLRGRTTSGEEIHGVVCVADDRLYRRPEDLTRFHAALTSRPGRVYVDRGGIRDPYSPDGLLHAVRSLETAVAETQVRSRRVRDWHWARAVEGKPHSGPRPFGWNEDRITLHPEEAALVEQAISERIAGKAIRAIAREWCGLRITGTRGARLSAQSVTQIITAPRVCGYRANKGELVIDPETGRPVLGQWHPITTPERWQAVCETFSAGSLYLHRGSGAPRLTGLKATPRHVGSGILRCGATAPDGGECRGALCAQKGRSTRSPYVYTCRSCARCSISGPLADEALERLLFSETRPVAVALLLDAMHGRWASGLMSVEERRALVKSVLDCCVVRPGVKGSPSWDYSRVRPVWMAEPSQD